MKFIKILSNKQQQQLAAILILDWSLRNTDSANQRALPVLCQSGGKKTNKKNFTNKEFATSLCGDIQTQRILTSP